MLLSENKGWNLILHRIWRGFIFWRGLVVIINLFWIPSGFSCFHSHISQLPPLIWYCGYICSSLTWSNFSGVSPELLSIPPLWACYFSLLPLCVYSCLSGAVWKCPLHISGEAGCWVRKHGEGWRGSLLYLGQQRHTLFSPCCAPAFLLLSSFLQLSLLHSCDAMQALCTLLMNLSCSSKGIPNS